MGEEEVVEVGVLLEWRNISSSILPWPDGDVATSAAAFQEMQRRYAGARSFFKILFKGTISKNQVHSDLCGLRQ